MDVQEAYNLWAEQYDTNINKTRDLEAVSLRETLQNLQITNCLEIGSGTGKNTEWLLTIANNIVAVDLSEEMLSKAKSKITSDKVNFIQANIMDEWTFAADQNFDLVTFSLVLEHIEDLDKIFGKLKQVTMPNAFVYIGELHPFKQYNGTKARFETENGLEIVTCFDHHISDFALAAEKNGFKIVRLREYFDDNARTHIPRIFTLLLQKQEV